MEHQTTNSMYPFYWQHGEKHEVLNEYMEQILRSGMKGVCVEARPHPEFVQEGWWNDMDFIIEKAKELHMKMWILDDSHFPTGYANGKIKEDYPQYLKWYLDMRRYDVQGPMKRARIDFKLLKGRPWERPDFSEKIFGVYMAKRCSHMTQEGDPIDASTLIDISSQFCERDRLLTLDIPKGAYSIFIVYQTQKNGEEATKDYLNPLVKQATQILVEEVYETHYQHYKEEFGKTILGFFSDEPRFGNAKGTNAAIGAEMVLPWREGLEKLFPFEEKLLPLLWVPANGAESQIRLSYMDIITKEYHENFTKVLADWCNAHGVWYLGHTIEDNGAHARLGYGTGHYFRGQEDMDMAGIDTIGGQIVPGMNYHHDAFNTGGSNGEFYHYSLAKLASSAAHLECKKQGRAMCEAFGAYGWNEGLKAMKWIADHLMVRGINYLVPHAFNPKEFPDFDCPPHFYAHGHNPQFRYYSYFSAYVNRVTNIFKGGKYPGKVALYYPAETEWMGAYMPVEKPARQLTQNQIAFDIVTTDYLKNANISEKVFAINEQCMECLVVAQGECISNEMVEIVSRLLKKDIPVYFIDSLPERAVGFESVYREFEFVCQNAEVIKLADIGDVLKKYRAFDLRNLQPDLVVGEYEKDDKKYYMFFNENICDSINTTIGFQEKKLVYAYDAWKDQLFNVTLTEEGYPLHLSSYETIIWVLSEKRLECNGTKEKAWKKENKDYLKDLKWNVSYCNSMNYPNFDIILPLEKLDCIQTIEGWEDKVGTVRYQTNIRFDTVDQHPVLDLGQVYETAEVFVNGVSAGVRLSSPYQFELTDLLNTGQNEIIIEVTNTLGTAIRDGISHYMPIEPFGIEGPVNIWVQE